MVFILGINGSNRGESGSLIALKNCLAAVGSANESEVINLSELQLPLFSPDEDYSKNAKVRKLRELAEKADGFVWSTPEYHGNMTGVLKNALDFLEISNFKNKVVGLIGIAGGSIGAVQAITSMSFCVRNLEAWTCPDIVSISRSKEAFKSGEIADPAVEKRLRLLGEEVAKWAEVHRKHR